MQLDKATLDGLYLFNQSPDHRMYTLVEFNHYYILPLLHSKVQLFYEKHMPVGLCTWCWFTEDEAKQFLAEALEPSEEHYSRPDDNTQYQLWGIEFIAPYGHARSVMRGMRDFQKRQRRKTEKVRWRRLKSPDTEIRRKF